MHIDNMDEEEEISFLLMVLKMCYLANKYLKRRWWVQPLYQKRNDGFFNTTFQYMKKHNSKLFFKSTRMSILQYNLLLSLIEDSLKKTSIRRPIKPECRLAVCLVYLSQGVSPKYLARSFRMGVSTVRAIILEVCDVLWKVLSPGYMPKLKGADWKEISHTFSERWNMPLCVGCIDGKHIQTKRPPNSGENYKNYKGFFSVILMGVCDANYIFTAVDVNADGTRNDNGIFRNTAFGDKLIKGKQDLPQPDYLPNSHYISPYYFIGSAAFPLRCNLMRPYPGQQNNVEEFFNSKLTKTLSLIETAFGILTARWRILGKCIDFLPKNTKKIILACTILHNFVKSTAELYDNDAYCPDYFPDIYGSDDVGFENKWRESVQQLLPIKRCGSNNRSEEASQFRKQLAEYFVYEEQRNFKYCHDEKEDF